MTQGPLHLSRFAAAAVVFGLGVALSFVVSATMVSQAQETADRWLADRAEVVADATMGTVDEALAGISSTAAFIEQSNVVTAEEFTGFVESLPPSIRLIGVAYISIIDSNDLDAYLANRRISEPEFTIFELDDDGQPAPIQRTDGLLFPVERFVPGPFLAQSLAEEEGDAMTLSIGYEAGSEESWLPSLEYLFAEGSVVVSDFVSVGGGVTDLGKAFVVAAPVRDDDGTIVGAVAAPMVDFLLTTGVDLAMTGDVTWSLSTDGSAIPSAATSITTIDFPGISWDLIVQPESGELDTGAPGWMITSIGIAVSAMMASVVHLLLQRRRSRRHLEELERIDDEKNRFLASVSHEIRTPLTVVTGLAHEIQAARVRMNSSEGEELMDLLVEQGDEVAAIVEDLLVASRSDMNDVVIAAESIDLDELARTVLRGARIDVKHERGRAPAFGDPQRVKQILRNLLSNARRYGGPDVRIRVGTDGQVSWISVADSGPPIPHDDRSAMFEAYTTSHPPATYVESMGLGLFVSSTLARLQGGDLSYEHDGAFSVFTLRLPTAESPVTDHAAPPETSVTPPR